jgi:hypothetical protein
MSRLNAKAFDELSGLLVVQLLKMGNPTSELVGLHIGDHMYGIWKMQRNGKMLDGSIPVSVMSFVQSGIGVED